ncbi:PorT family protein [Hymenobacter aquaticus]|uniref:PorT family protein n=1 Tax=Hymenobacter aquaticus TaxID=1867101 RepID=A0A4Z0Q3L4_9BACT|nr:porin family protein [Hymenobacter aquaticus]TGE24079.1 PorT family protein [Hymenobacter aquaticus]
MDGALHLARMSKLFLPCAILILGSISCQAQSPRFGLKAGVNYSNTYIPNVTRPDRILGVAAGGFAQVALSQDGFFLLQPELMYSAKGSEQRFQGKTYQGRLHYLELPVLAKINADGFVFEAGPQLSYLLAARNETPVGTFTDLSGANRLVVGAVAGVGYQLPMGLGLTLRYANDLTRISDAGPRSSVYQLQASYLLTGK